MPLTSVKLTPKEKEEIKGGAVEIKPPEFPHGLRLSFNEDTIDKVSGINTLKAGEKVRVMAEGTVKRVTKTEVDNDEDFDENRTEIQLEAIEVTKPDDFSDGFKDAAKDK